MTTQAPNTSTSHEQEIKRLHRYVMPLAINNKVIGFIGMDTIRETKIWSDDLLKRLYVVGEMLANALSRKYSEKALQQAHRQLTEEHNMFINGAVVVFKWLDAEGWPVEYVSRNVGEVLGYQDAALLQHEIEYSELIHHDDFERVVQEVATHSDNGSDRFQHQPYRLRRKDGELRNSSFHLV
jgi:PAS domain-containing protein